MNPAIEPLWGALSNGGAPTRGEFRVFETWALTAEGPALLALDDSGMRHLLLPVRSSSAVDADERSAGVHLLGRILAEQGKEHHFVDLACRKPHLSGVFNHLVEEVLQALPQEPGRPATISRRVLNRWRELLDRDAPGVLGPEALEGLYGELVVLRRLAEINAAAVEWWTGPLRARHDFSRAGAAVEVKTTMSMDRPVVRIHGVDQLEPPSDGQLHLAVITVERAATAGESVPDIVAGIERLGVDAMLFSSRLRDAKYSPVDAVHYAGTRFVQRSVRTYPVVEGLPRITRRSFDGGALPLGVSDFDYSLDLSAAAVSPLDEKAFQQLLQAIAS